MQNPFLLFFSTVFSTLAVIILCIAITAYVFNSIGLYCIAKRRGLSAPYTAWIPFASTFLFGKIAEQYEAAERGKSKPHKKILLGLEIPYVILNIICNFAFASLIHNTIFNSEMFNYGSYAYQSLEPYIVYEYIFSYILSAVGIAYFVFYYIALYKVYRSLSPSTTTMYLVLSILFGIAPFVLFANRKKDEGFIDLNNKYRAARESGQYQDRNNYFSQGYGQQSNGNPQYPQGAPYWQNANYQNAPQSNVQQYTPNQQYPYAGQPQYGEAYQQNTNQYNIKQRYPQYQTQYSPYVQHPQNDNNGQVYQNASKTFRANEETPDNSQKSDVNK